MKKVNRSSVTGKFVTKNYAAKHKKTTETETIVPKTANTFNRICGMKRDNVTTSKSWMIINVKHVTITNQRSGESLTGQVSLTKKEFEKFIRFYETGQVTPSRHESKQRK